MIDYDVVEVNYNAFPSIRRVMSPNWLRRVRRKQSHHPLAELLWVADGIRQEKVEFEKIRTEMRDPSLRDESSGYLEKWLKFAIIPPRMQRILALEHLDSCLSQLFCKHLDVLEYRKELRNDRQFWDVYSEVECASLVSKHYGVNLKPKVGGHVLDFKLVIDNSEVLVEVRAARAPFIYSKTKAGFVGDRVPAILKEEAEQFRLPRLDKRACLVIFDASGSAIEPTLQGPSENSIPRQISAVLMYKMDFWWDSKPHYMDKVLVINKAPRSELSKDLADAICSCLS